MMPNYDELLKMSNKIKLNLAHNQLIPAIDKLMELVQYIDNESIKNNVIIISARVYEERDKKIKDTKLQSDRIENNKIIEAILDLLGSAEKTIIEKSAEEISVKEEQVDTFSSVSHNIKLTASEVNDMTDNKLIDLLLNNSSIYGLMILYALKVGYNNRKTIDLRKVAELVNGNLDYFEGYLNPLEATHILGITKVKGSSLISINYLDKRIEKEIENRIDAILSKYKNDTKSGFICEAVLNLKSLLN